MMKLHGLTFDEAIETAVILARTTGKKRYVIRSVFRDGGWYVISIPVFTAFHWNGFAS